MDKMANIIYEYSLKHKLLDTEIVKVLVAENLKENDLEDYVEYVVTDKKRLDTSWGNKHLLGEYDFRNRIYIYLNEINLFIENNVWKTKYHKEAELDSFFEYIAKNIFIVETIIHEVHHAKQMDMFMDSNDKSMEKQLIKLEYDYILPTFNTFNIAGYFNYFTRRINYYHCYSISPMERLTNITVRNKVNELINRLNLDNDTLKNIYLNMRDDYLLKAYRNNLIGPTFRFLVRTNHMGAYIASEAFIETLLLDLDDTIKYGYPITKEDYIMKKTKCK